MLACVYALLLLILVLCRLFKYYSYKKKISNDNCTECPMNTVSNVNRNSCVCKDGYYKRSSDSSESSPCYGKFVDSLLFPAFRAYLL
jgi:hypothetical protein